MEKINKHKKPSSYIYKLFIYVALLALAISIIIPVAWVFMASLKRNSEFIGGDVSPWALPKEFFVQNFVVAFRDANMGTFFLNSVIVTATALILLLLLAHQLHCSTDLPDAQRCKQIARSRLFPE